MSGFKGVVTYVKGNPVLMLDLVKYALAALVLFGLPIPAGLDVILAGAILTALTIVTAGQVTPAAKADLAYRTALYTPVPDEPVVQVDPAVTADATVTSGHGL